MNKKEHNHSTTPYHTITPCTPQTPGYRDDTQNCTGTNEILAENHYLKDPAENNSRL